MIKIPAVEQADLFTNKKILEKKKNLFGSKNRFSRFRNVRRNTFQQKQQLI